MPVKYIAVINGGREVSLYGTAGYDYWKARLARENLVPIQTSNGAELLLSAVELKWMGVRFSELSVSISAKEVGDTGKAGIYLASAFNTSKVFSLIERNWFHTPYCYAQVNVTTQTPWSFQLSDGANTILQARRHATVAPKECETGWKGAIYLPSRGRGPRQHFDVFFASLSGVTAIAPFDDSYDRIDLAAAKHAPIIQLLIDSGFTAREWRVRSNATHARSKTYKRGFVP